MKRRVRAIAVFSAVLLLTGLASSASAQLNLPRVSPKSTISQTVGVSHVTITYSRPSVNERTIWGELVPWDKVWRTGANEVTTIALSDEVMIEGKKLAAGSYSIHTIPGREEWTLIFNKLIPESGYRYDEKQDALRITVKPEPSDDFHELLTFVFPLVSESTAEIAILWEKLRVPFSISVDLDAVALPGIREAVAKAPADDWRTPFQAANYAYSSEKSWSDAMTWIDRAIAINSNYNTLGLKARMLARAGRTEEALANARRAVEAGKASEQKVDTSALEKLIAEWSTKG